MYLRLVIAITLYVIAVHIIFALEYSQQVNQVPSDRLLTDQELLYILKDDLLDIESVYSLRDQGKYSAAIEELTQYLKDKFGDRFYFDWRNFDQRLEQYKNNYPDIINKHRNGSDYFRGTYSGDPKWILPFNNLKGEAVTAYQLRHLARQSWTSDIVLDYAFSSNDELLDYVMDQVASLNRAFNNGEYDDSGNGIYETFRAGKRIHKWLFAHQVFLSRDDYSVDQQILMLKTFLHHGAQLQERTKKNRYGNHHTKGLVALFEIAVLLPEFSSSQHWINQALSGLEWHITNEINTDGFQFERSVHYHVGDIENYFRVCQLAQRNGIQLPAVFRERFFLMFEALTKLAQPNKRLPVLQDDTDKRFAENNIIDDAMIVGAILFKDSRFKYFIENDVSELRYWLFSKHELDFIESLSVEAPVYGSISLPETGYYTMRNGWDEGSEYMTISAAVSEHKPDHQHGDVLGVVAWANGHEILPNYQVKYSYPDYPQWKNSWAKNVALVDSIPQGRNWKGNRGGSGFGKWLELPEPTVLRWETNDNYDYFLGSHDGFKSVGVEYFREVLFIKAGFWLIMDHFESSGIHRYQQVWQGKYQYNSGSLLTKSYQQGSRLAIRQLNNSVEYNAQTGRIDPMDHITVDVSNQTNFTFISLLLPLSSEEALHSGLPAGWYLAERNTGNTLMINQFSTNALAGLTDGEKTYIFFDLTNIQWNGRYLNFETSVSIIIGLSGNECELKLLGPAGNQLWTDGKVQIAGELLYKQPNESFRLKSGAILKLIW